MSKKVGRRAEVLERAVLIIRGRNVMLDDDLARLYEVEVRALNQAVKRNRRRFPPDFMFVLTAAETRTLRSQTVIARRAHGGRRTLAYAFTEQGVAMLSTVLRSERAVHVNIEIMRAFVRLRRMLRTNEELSRRLDALEQRHDGQFRAVFQAIRELMAPSRHPGRTIGFR